MRISSPEGVTESQKSSVEFLSVRECESTSIHVSPSSLVLHNSDGYPFPSLYRKINPVEDNKNEVFQKLPFNTICQLFPLSFERYRVSPCKIKIKSRGEEIAN